MFLNSKTVPNLLSHDKQKYCFFKNQFKNLFSINQMPCLISVIYCTLKYFLINRIYLEYENMQGTARNNDYYTT